MTDTPFGNSFFNVRSAEKCTVFVLGGPVPVGRLSSQPTASACSSCRSLATRWCGLGPLTMWVIHTVVGVAVYGLPTSSGGDGHDMFCQASADVLRLFTARL